MSYIANYVHLIWSTANREPTIRAEWEPRLFACIGGLLQKERAKLLAAGGIEDHVHILASLPATLSYSDAAGIIKANSSRFIHDELEEYIDFLEKHEIPYDPKYVFL